MEHKLCARVANLLMGSGLFVSVALEQLFPRVKIESLESAFSIRFGFRV